jgi:hypothetical protein
MQGPPLPDQKRLLGVHHRNALHAERCSKEQAIICALRVGISVGRPLGARRWWHLERQPDVEA